MKSFQEWYECVIGEFITCPQSKLWKQTHMPTPPVFPSWLTFLFIFSLSLRMCVINQSSVCRGGIPLGFLAFVLLHLDLMSTPVCHQLILLPLLKLTEVHQKMSDHLTNTISAVGFSPLYVCYVFVLWLALICFSICVGQPVWREICLKRVTNV